jgi:hypothetical protein
LREAIVGSEWVANMAVSSANVLRIVFLVIGCGEGIEKWAKDATLGDT